MSQRKRNQKTVDEEDEKRSAFQPFSRQEPPKKQQSRRGKKKDREGQATQVAIEGSELPILPDEAVQDLTRWWQENPQSFPSDDLLADFSKKYKIPAAVISKWFTERGSLRSSMVMRPTASHYSALMPIQHYQSSDMPTMPMLMPQQPQIIQFPMQGLFST